MKNITKVIIVLTSVFISSCAPSVFYQVYNVNTDNEIKTETHAMIFEDENCMVSYDLWQENGQMEFTIYNKTNDYIYINLDRSFFILNGYANPYFKNRSFTTATNVGSTLTSSGFSETRMEKRVKTLPAQSSIRISEYTINEYLIRDCDLLKYPNRKEVNTINFAENDSPIVFRNLIVYKTDETGVEHSIENSFYVAGVTNYPQNEILEYRYEEFCGQKSSTRKPYLKTGAANRFYIKYTKSLDGWKH